MLFQITRICFNKSDNVTLQSMMNVMSENGAKMTQNAAIMVLSRYYQVPVRKVILQAHHDRCFG